MKSNRLAWVFLIGMTILAVSAPFLPLKSPAGVDLENVLQNPGWVQAPLLGTDIKGRDLLARTLYGARVSLWVGFLGSLIALAVGVPYGTFAGLKGGRWDRIMMRLADGLESLPLVVVLLFVLTIAQEYRAELNALGIQRIHLFFIAVGLLFWLPTARVARSEALRLKETEFVHAARSMGAASPRLIRLHLLPNMAPAILVMMTLTVPRVVLMEAFLSFLGLGVEPPAISWGLLASEGLAALSPILDCWWVLAVPAGALVLTLWSLNQIGDAFRDALRGKRSDS